MSRALAIATAILTILRSYVSAQTPTCHSGYGWSFNSLVQSPCNMTLVLGDVCSNNVPIGLPSLSGLGFVYLGPTQPGTNNSCLCSTVVYSLMSACAYCQGASVLNWSSYHVNCIVVYPQVFPSPLPSSIVVPHYAYLDVVTNDTFDVTAAMSASLSGPESTPVPQSTTVTSTLTSTQVSTLTVSASSTPSTSVASTPTSAAPTPTSVKLNVGAIVGGVVGGVAGIIIVAGLISTFVVLRCLKRRSTPTPSTHTAPQTMMDKGPGAG